MKKSAKKIHIALLYHYVPKKADNEYYSHEHSLVDNQTDEIVTYMKRLFQKKRYLVKNIEVKPNDLSALRHIKADLVYNLVDSKAMEIKISKILERINTRFTGTGSQGIINSNNKIKSKLIFSKFGLPTPKFKIIQINDRISRLKIPSKFPVIVKPAYEHCSIGITNNSIAQNYIQFKNIIKKLRKEYNQTLIAEEFIKGKEYQVTVLERDKETIALPIAEIAFKRNIKNKWNIYGFDEKWDKKNPVYKSCHFVAPPKGLKEDISSLIKKDAIRAFYALNMKDYARFDIRYNPLTRNWYFLEGNANAGFDPDPRDAMTVSIYAQKMTLDDFILQIVNNNLPAIHA